MKELITIQSTLKAPKGQYNSFGKYKYRSCEDIQEAVKPLLAEQGCFLTISDDIISLDGRFYVKATATLTNSEGQVISVTAFARESETKTGMDASQITGSASSYARKYALNGLFAIDDTKDADTMDNRTKPAPTKKGMPQLVQPEDADPYTLIAEATDKETLKSIFARYPAMQKQQTFLTALSNRKKELGIT